MYFKGNSGGGLVWFGVWFVVLRGLLCDKLFALLLIVLIVYSKISFSNFFYHLYFFFTITKIIKRQLCDLFLSLSCSSNSKF